MVKEAVHPQYFVYAILFMLSMYAIIGVLVFLGLFVTDLLRFNAEPEFDENYFPE